MQKEKERERKGKGLCNGKEKDCVKLWGERRESGEERDNVSEIEGHIDIKSLREEKEGERKKKQRGRNRKREKEGRENDCKYQSIT